VIRALIIALAFVTAVPVVHAQPGLGPAAADKREKIKKKIRALRAYTLTEELSLDETTAGRLFPVMAKYDDELDRLIVQRADIERRLKAAGDLKDPRALDHLIDEAVANQHAFWDSQERRLVELRKILTPAQIARLLVVLPAIERKIQNQLQRAVRGGGPGRRALAGSGFDDDDDIAPDPRPRVK